MNAKACAVQFENILFSIISQLGCKGERKISHQRLLYVWSQRQIHRSMQRKQGTFIPYTGQHHRPRLDAHLSFHASCQIEFVGKRVMDGQDVNCFHNYLGYTALQAACDATSYADSGGQLTLVKILIQAKVLVMCCCFGHCVMWSSSRQTHLSLTPPSNCPTLSNQAAVNATRRKCGGATPDMNTALHFAAAAGRTAVIEFLVLHGAKKLLRNFHRQIPLDMAIMHRKHEAAQILRDYPALCGMCYLTKVRMLIDAPFIHRCDGRMLPCLFTVSVTSSLVIIIGAVH